MAGWFKIFIIVAPHTDESRCSRSAFMHTHTTASVSVMEQQSTVWPPTWKVGQFISCQWKWVKSGKMCSGLRY